MDISDIIKPPVPAEANDLYLISKLRKDAVIYENTKKCVGINDLKTQFQGIKSLADF